MSEESDSRLAKAVRIFAPEQWGQLDYFAKLYSGTYKFSKRETRALAGVSAHFEKGQIFLNIAQELKPRLAVDREQLNKHGFSPTNHSRKLAAVIEASALEFYSTVDCCAQVLRATFGPSTRGFRKSTRYLFTDHAKIVGLPEPIVRQLASASWYRRLRHLRDELTHCDTGSCSLDDETGLVRYMHTGVSEKDKPLIIEDIFDWLETNMHEINGFLGRVFHQLNITLSDEPVLQICGITRGRMLTRMVIPTDPMTFDNGYCKSFEWFELPENPSCPFMEDCGAYDQAKRS